MQTLVAGLVIFFAAHAFAMCRAPRERLVQRLGPLVYRGLFSLVSIVGFVLIVRGYAHAPLVTVWTPPTWMRHVTMTLMLPVFVFFTAAYLPGHIKARIKNPMLMGLKTWATAHLLANGDLAGMLLFGSFLVYGVVDLIAVKRSGRSPVVAAPRAVYDIVAVVVGLGVYVLFVVWAHAHLIGRPLLMH